MRKNFFGRFSPTEKTHNKSISMPESDWRLLEAYRLYGSAAAGHEIPLQKIIREMLTAHMASDRVFAKKKDEWLSKLAEISPRDAAEP